MLGVVALGGHVIDVLDGPGSQLSQRDGGAVAEVGEGVLDVQGYGGDDRAVEEAGFLEAPQRLSEHFRADALEFALQLPEAAWAVLERSDGQRGPLVGQ